ncbi:hypothetical protein [Actinomadura terrae]|uniref:hypothetical protein n=1 Tax=Actinomadura terrae TaxID=604353 RepID=UPI001FA7325C|nr:hypothetical protein [Actinomadura terrae]
MIRGLARVVVLLPGGSRKGPGTETPKPDGGAGARPEKEQPGKDAAVPEENTYPLW